MSLSLEITRCVCVVCHCYYLDYVVIPNVDSAVDLHMPTSIKHPRRAEKADDAITGNLQKAVLVKTAYEQVLSVMSAVCYLAFHFPPPALFLSLSYVDFLQMITQ